MLMRSRHQLMVTMPMVVMMMLMSIFLSEIFEILAVLFILMIFVVLTVMAMVSMVFSFLYRGLCRTARPLVLIMIITMTCLSFFMDFRKNFDLSNLSRSSLIFLWAATSFIQFVQITRTRMNSL